MYWRQRRGELYYYVALVLAAKVQRGIIGGVSGEEEFSRAIIGGACIAAMCWQVMQLTLAWYHDTRVQTRIYSWSGGDG